MRRAILTIIPLVALVALLELADAQQCGIEADAISITVRCTGIPATTVVDSITVNGQAQTRDLPLVIPRSSLITGTNIIVINFEGEGGSRSTSTLRVTIGAPTSREISCGSSVVEDGRHIEVSCTINSVPFTGPARFSINTPVGQDSEQRLSMPFSIPITEFMADINTIYLLLEVDGEEIEGPPVTVTLNTESTTLRCQTLKTSDGQNINVTCFVNGELFAGDATYTINDDPAVDISEFPQLIKLESFSREENSLVISLNINGVVRTFRTQVRLQSAPAPISCSYVIRGGVVTITCTGGDIASYSYRINGSSEISGMGSVNIVIGVDSLDIGPNTVNVTLFAADQSVLGHIPVTFNINPVFDPKCSIENIGLITQVTCSAPVGTEQIDRYTYSGAITGSGTEFPIEINRTLLQFDGDNVISLTLISESGQTNIVRITLQRSRPFKVQCEASQTSDFRNIEISCTVTDTNSQTIDSIRYFINGAIQETVGGDEQPIVIPVTHGDVMVGELNNFILVVTGSDGADLSFSIDLQVQDIPPQCTTTDNEVGIIRIRCTEGIRSIQSYRILINEREYRFSSDAAFPIVIDTNISELGEDENEVVLVLYGDTGGTVELSRQTYTIQRRSFTVECRGMFVDDGDLEITCSTPAGDQTISRLEYSVNNGSRIQVERLPFIIEASKLTDINNVVNLIITGSQGSQVTPSLVFQAPIDCSHMFMNGELVIRCVSGGNEVEATYEIRINNGSLITGSVFPIRIGPDLLSDDMNEISVILIGSDGRILSRQIIRIQTIRCSYAFINDELVITCLSGGNAVEATYEITINSGSIITGSQFPIRIRQDQLSSDMNVISVILRGSDSRILSQQIIQFQRVVCTYTATFDEITITCTGGLDAVARLQYSINSGPPEVASISDLPIVISTSNSQLIPTDPNTIVLTLFREDGSELAETTFTIQIPPSELILSCPFDGVPGRLTVTCTANVPVTYQCKFDEEDAEDCTFPLTVTIGDFGTTRHTLVVTARDDFGQTATFTLEFQLTPTLPPQTERIDVDFPSLFTLSEGSLQSRLFFGIIGTAVDRVPFSLVPLTYQQFEDRTGQSVTDVFSSFVTVIPPPASDGDISPAERLDSGFGPAEFPLAGDLIYNVGSAVINDDEREEDEGFILYFEFNESAINPADFSRLDIGTGAILVTIQDDDTPLNVTCAEITDTFVRGIDCTSSGGSGPFIYTCTLDNDPITPCPPAPLMLNLLKFSQGEHNVTIVVTDSIGSTSTFIYRFTGLSAPDLVLSVSPRYLVVDEDGTGGSVQVTKRGYSFGEVSFTLRPLTYTEYLSITSGRSLDRLFPFRPREEASETDFDGRVQSSSFSAGLVTQGPVVFDFSGLALPDSESELTEGLLLYLEIDESSLDSRDIERLRLGNIRVESSLVLASITSNNLPLTCSAVRDALQLLTVDCTGSVPTQVVSNSVRCTLNDETIPCSQLHAEFGTTSASTGTYIVTVSGSTTTGESVALGEVTFSVQEIDFYFINNTPLLVGGTVYAEFRADRTGLRFFCHLTHLDDDNFREDCSNGTYRREGIPKGDFTLRVIAIDPVSGERKVIRNRLWVHSTLPDDQFCIMYLRNRGWGVVGNTFSVDFTGTGAASGDDAEFECSLDRATPQPCTSSYVVENLSPGRHHVRVRPTGCRKDYRVWNKRFTIPDE